MNEPSYKEQFIAKHGEIAYMQKLKENAAWRKANPEAMAEYAEKRSKKASGSDKIIYFVGDVHIGSSGTDEDEIKAMAKKYWRGKPIVLMGDLCDLGLDRGMSWDNKFGPQTQYDIAKEIFKPLDVRAFTIGNHEERIWNKVGIQPFNELFDMKPSNDLIFGDKKLFFNHGVSAAQDPFKEHQRYIKWKNADIFCLGHSHVLAYIPYMYDKKRVYLCRTGSFLRPVKYTKAAGYDPKIRGWIEYNTEENVVHLKAINDETGEVFDI
jgi:predicted phosphodiesterase